MLSFFGFINLCFGRFFLIFTPNPISNKITDYYRNDKG